MSELPRGLLLFDTSAYIGQIRYGRYPWLASDRSIFERTVMTAVVAAELGAGCRSREDRAALASLCRAHAALGRLSFPSLENWTMAGDLLQRYARGFGTLRFADHFRDVLIALEALRHNATLVTENVADFRRWQKLLRSSGQSLRILDLRSLHAS